MRTLGIIIAGCLLLTFGCGGEETKVEETKDAPKAAPEEKAPELAKEAAADEGATKLSGEGKTTPEEGEPATLPVALEIAKDGKITGSMEIKGVKHDVNGVLDGEAIRAWVTGGLGDPKSARRGTLLGEMIDGGAKGTFAVSNDGASEVHKGEWKVSSPGK